LASENENAQFVDEIPSGVDRGREAVEVLFGHELIREAVEVLLVIDHLWACRVVGMHMHRRPDLSISQVM
jgi:hypothetical protein